jgi:hypothetical protein
MVIFEEHSYIEKLNDWSKVYAKSLLQSFATVKTIIDIEFAKSAIESLDTFAPVINKACINDMNAFHSDLSRASSLQEDYDSFGQYCYEILKQAYAATNETMSLNTKLHYDLESMHNFVNSDVTVATGFVAYNYFSGIGTLLLTDFKNMSGIGLTFNMSLQAKSIQVNNIQEQMLSKLNYYSEIGNVIHSLNTKDVIFDKLRDWSYVVNETLIKSKQMSELAWQCTYQAYKGIWLEMSLTKLSKNTVCNMSVKSGRLLETVHQKGRTKTVNFGTDIVKVMQLDYFNNLNFTLE